MNIYTILALLISLSAAAGMNLYATILVLGLSIRFGGIENIPTGLELFASDWVLILSGLLFILEFFSDKIQFIDNLWDIIHTIIRPLGAILIGLSALVEPSPELILITALFTGGTALLTHTGKTGTRIALNLFSPLENISNIIISLTENIFVILLVLLALIFPLIALSIVLILLLIIILFIPKLLGKIRKVFGIRLKASKIL